MAESNTVEVEEFNVAFMPSGRRGRFAKGTTVLDAARPLHCGNVAQSVYWA